MPSPAKATFKPTDNGFKDIPFGEYALSSSVTNASTKVKKTYGAAGSNDVWGATKQGETTISGVAVCTGVKVNVDVQDSFWVPLTPSVGNHTNGYSVYAGDSAVDVEVSYTPYTPSIPTSTDPPPVDESQGELEDFTSTEWSERTTIIQSGFNLKCIYDYDKTTLGKGEIRAQRNITNQLIPDKTTGKRIGELAVYQSAKNLDVSIPFVPIFLMKPGEYCNVKISSQYIDKIDRIESIEMGESETGNQIFNLNFRIAETDE